MKNKFLSILPDRGIWILIVPNMLKTFESGSFLAQSQTVCGLKFGTQEKSGYQKQWFI